MSQSPNDINDDLAVFFCFYTPIFFLVTSGIKNAYLKFEMLKTPHFPAFDRPKGRKAMPVRPIRGIWTLDSRVLEFAP